MLIDFAKKLISIPSTKESPEKLQEILDVTNKELKDFKSKKFISNGVPSVLFYNTPELPNKFKIILNAHLDVVPGLPEQYLPIEKDGKLFGRGALDMKSAAAAEILAFREMAKKVNFTLDLQLVTDEEIGGVNGTKYQIDQGIKSDFVIAGENTNLKLNNMAKGIYWIKIKAAGTSAHSAYLWQGKNAVWRMNEFLNKLKKLFPEPEHEQWITTANLSAVSTSNQTFNKVPDECIVMLDIRYIPEEAETIEAKIKHLLPDKFTLENVFKEPAQFTDKTNPYLKKLIKSINTIVGKYTGYISKHGASDIRHFHRVGIPGVCFGPTGEGIHSENEWVDISSLENYYQILLNYISSI
jgi:succinyl-diaminopimelate desuccinylase